MDNLLRAAPFLVIALVISRAMHHHVRWLAARTHEDGDALLIPFEGLAMGIQAGAIYGALVTALWPAPTAAAVQILSGVLGAIVFRLSRKKDVRHYWVDYAIGVTLVTVGALVIGTGAVRV